jgi:hypothetical protein
MAASWTRTAAITIASTVAITAIALRAPLLRTSRPRRCRANGCAATTAIPSTTPTAAPPARRVRRRCGVAIPGMGRIWIGMGMGWDVNEQDPLVHPIVASYSPRNLMSPMSKWFRWDDAASWTPLLEAFPADDASPEDILARAEQIYDGVAVFHGCRPENIQSYLSDGVRPMPLSVLHDIVRETIRNTFPKIPEKAIELAIDSAPKPAQPARVYACVDARQLLLGINSFSAGGSEHVQIVLIQLGNICDQDFSLPLSQRGRPAILMLGIRWSEVNTHIREELGHWLKRELRTVRNGGDIAPRQWCHSQETAFPPENILRIYWLDDNSTWEPPYA